MKSPRNQLLGELQANWLERILLRFTPVKLRVLDPYSGNMYEIKKLGRKLFIVNDGESASIFGRTRDGKS